MRERALETFALRFKYVSAVVVTLFNTNPALFRHL
jgi:hypothetical protein